MTSWHDLILAALREFLANLLGDTCEVRIGWVGNEPSPSAPESAILGLEATAGPRDLAPAEVASWTTPDEADEEPKTEVVLDYGNQVVPIVANLYVRSRAHGKTRRGQIVGTIEQAFAPTTPGLTQCACLTLADPAQTGVRITIESVAAGDFADAIARNEWRAILRFEARHSLRTTVETPYLRTIAVGVDSDTPAPVDSIA